MKIFNKMGIYKKHRCILNTKLMMGKRIQQYLFGLTGKQDTDVNYIVILLSLLTSFLFNPQASK